MCALAAERGRVRQEEHAEGIAKHWQRFLLELTANPAVLRYSCTPSKSIQMAGDFQLAVEF